MKSMSSLTLNESSSPMRLARWCAALIIVGVGTAAFVLSFDALRSLASRAHIPAGLSWLLPVDIDGTIILATVGWLAMADRPERVFFSRLLAAGAVVSVAGNSLHAVMPIVPAWVCAVVAAIPPVSLLLDTHGLAVLFRTVVTPAPAVIDPPIASTVSETPVPAVAEMPVPVVAAPTAPRPKVVTPEQIATAVAMHAAGSTYRQIGRKPHISPATAHKYVARATTAPAALRAA